MASYSLPVHLASWQYPGKFLEISWKVPFLNSTPQSGDARGLYVGQTDMPEVMIRFSLMSVFICRSPVTSPHVRNIKLGNTLSNGSEYAVALQLHRATHPESRQDRHAPHVGL